MTSTHIPTGYELTPLLIAMTIGESHEGMLLPKVLLPKDVAAELRKAPSAKIEALSPITPAKPAKRPQPVIPDACPSQPLGTVPVFGCRRARSAWPSSGRLVPLPWLIGGTSKMLTSTRRSEHAVPARMRWTGSRCVGTARTRTVIRPHSGPRLPAAFVPRCP